MSDIFSAFETARSDIPPITQAQLRTGVTVSEVNSTFAELDTADPDRGGRVLVLGAQTVMHGSAASVDALSHTLRIMRRETREPSPAAAIMLRGANDAAIGGMAFQMLRAMGRISRRDQPADDTPDRVAEELAHHIDRTVTGSALFLNTALVRPSGKGDKLTTLIERYIETGSQPYSDATSALQSALFHDAIELAKGTPKRSNIGKQMGRVLMNAYDWMPEREKGRLSVDSAPSEVAKLKTERIVVRPSEPIKDINPQAEQQIADIKAAHAELIARGHDGASFKVSGKRVRAEGLATVNRLITKGYENTDRNITLEDIDKRRTPIVLGLLLSIQKWTQEGIIEGGVQHGVTHAREQLAQLIAREQELAAQLKDVQNGGDLATTGDSLQEAVQWMRAQRDAIGQVIINGDWPAASWEDRVDFAADFGMVLGAADDREGWDWLLSAHK